MSAISRTGADTAASGVPYGKREGLQIGVRARTEGANRKGAPQRPFLISTLDASIRSYWIFAFFCSSAANPWTRCCCSISLIWP